MPQLSGGSRRLLSMFRAGQKPFRASRSPVEWCIVDLGSRAEVGKYKIARNDPKFCPVVDFWILRTLYAGGDSVFCSVWPVRVFETLSGLLTGNSLPVTIQAQLRRQRSFFFVSSSSYMCAPTVWGVTRVPSMFRADQKPFRASRSPVDWC